MYSNIIFFTQPNLSMFFQFFIYLYNSLILHIITRDKLLILICYLKYYFRRYHLMNRTKNINFVESMMLIEVLRKLFKILANFCNEEAT